MGTLKLRRTAFYRAMQEFLEKRLTTFDNGVATRWQFDVPIQPLNRHQTVGDSSSCGVYVCYYMELLCDGIPPDAIASNQLSLDQINAYRDMILHSLITHLNIRVPD